MTINIFKKAAEKGVLILTVALFTACGSDTIPTANKTADSLANYQTEPKNNNGFYDIPSPVQEVQLLQKAGAVYDKSILNPLENVSKYNLVNSKAINLGVYGADLSYAAVFNQPQDVILYLTASQKLAESLNIKGDFYLDVMKRMEKGSTNKDSLLKIVSDVYQKSNESLKENDESHVSVIVIAGSFIEGMFIATQVAKSVKDKDAIYERIGEFKGSLSNLVGLMTTVHDVNFSDILSDLKSIKAIYDESPESRLSDDQIKKITKQVKAIRIRITNM
jgi:hypothetical protein